MATTLTVITENTVPGKAAGLYAEHGFSLFLSRPEARILFDAGPAGLATLNNAPRLGVDLKAADLMVLSHGHMDHTGGLAGVLRAIGKRIPVYAHPDVFTDRYAKLGERIIYSGLPFKREALEGMGAAFDLSTEFRQIAPGVYLSGEIARRRAFETGDVDLFVKQNGEFRKDPLRDDQSIAVETAEGLALILGCCHAGLINTIDHFQAKLPGKADPHSDRRDAPGLRARGAIARDDRRPERPRRQAHGPLALHGAPGRRAAGPRAGRRRRLLHRRILA